MKHIQLPLYTIVVFGDNTIAAMNTNTGNYGTRYAFANQQPNANGQTIGSFKTAHDAAVREANQLAQS